LLQQIAARRDSQRQAPGRLQLACEPFQRRPGFEGLWKSRLVAPIGEQPRRVVNRDEEGETQRRGDLGRDHNHACHHLVDHPTARLIVPLQCDA
jgi:hypothetical protein